jgi:hypothetical protein
MQRIIISFVFLGIVVLAIIGSLFIFELRTSEQALDLLLKSEGVLFLLAVCYVAVTLMLGSVKDNSPD